MQYKGKKKENKFSNPLIWNGNWNIYLLFVYEHLGLSFLFYKMKDMHLLILKFFLVIKYFGFTMKRHS